MTIYLTYFKVISQ